MATPPSSGPLAGTRVLELGSIGPGPLCGMLLADLGADVVRLDRIGGGLVVGPGDTHATEVVHRGRRSVGIDLRAPGAAELVLDLVAEADVLIEGNRPGVTERLGIGPEPCLERNPRLVYGRMTGWGQDGPRSSEVGHDINYIGLAGPLGLIGRAGQPPTPPMNFVGDYGGGAMLLAVGVLAALLERARSGKGQVVDAAMVDGAALLLAPILGWWQAGAFPGPRGHNLLDSGAPFYDTYACSDGRFLSVGAIEPKFHAELLELLGIDPDEHGHQYDASRWAEQKERIAAAVATKTRDAWVQATEGRETCVGPVLDLDELEHDEHLRARGTIQRRDGLLQPGIAPRFDRTPGALSRPPAAPGADTRAALADWGISDERVGALLDAGALAAPSGAPDGPREAA